MPMSASVPRYTADEIRRFPDDRLRYEVIRGQLFVTPAPGTRHQRGAGRPHHRPKSETGEALLDSAATPRVHSATIGALPQRFAYAGAPVEPHIRARL